jgi:hypothetical protein
MSHGSVLAKLKHGFHRECADRCLANTLLRFFEQHWAGCADAGRSQHAGNRLPWGFNADHQPVGGKYDSREVSYLMWQ